MAPQTTNRTAAARSGLLLILDTCGEQASLALFRLSDRSELLAERTLAERTASATLLGALRALLAEHGIQVGDLAAIGVVNGPGSFTGARVGLALAKGLCEANAVTLATASRLHVLGLAAGLAEGVAVLPAGRGQVYLREMARGTPAKERLAELSELTASVADQPIAVASKEMAETLSGTGRRVTQVSLSAAAALPAVLACLESGGSDVETANANYVREEASIYAGKLKGAVGSFNPPASSSTVTSHHDALSTND